ncbi:transcription factor S [Candidatus Bathyarchaeota archaeon]|nr:transcription factor S [Candidatus Bathyarchaeota archaeon]
MKFCSTCGTMCNIDHKKRCYICPKCGAEEPINDAPVIQRTKQNGEKIVVIGKKEQNLRTTPQVKANCPKCGNDKAYWWMVQTRGIDESSTQFYRCTKCGYTWRDYS